MNHKILPLHSDIVIEGEDAFIKYRDASCIYMLTSGEKVIGREVDTQNHLVYVVRKGEELDIIHALNTSIKETTDNIRLR